MSIQYDPDVYGYVNGKPTYSEQEFKLARRHGKTIGSDADLIAYAEQVTHQWYDAGWHRTFTSYYLSDYTLSEPRASLTRAEFDRLRELQAEARRAAKEADDAREWKLIGRYCYADNSVEEHYQDKNGVKRVVMVEYPHGD